MSFIAVEPHATLIEPWRQEHRGGSAADRMLSEVTTSLPPRISEAKFTVPSNLVTSMEGALRQVSALDHTHGEHLAPLATMLLRVESVASSKIERIEASVDDFARALHGSKANSSAVSMVAATTALSDLIGHATTGTDISLTQILRAHSLLMADDPDEKAYAGRIRDMQNWIGGSDYSPIGAMFVPPPPRLVADYLQDLLHFLNRDDLPVLVQAAVAHAQFESIHPFTDGNGRIGRALINTLFRRRGVTKSVVVPIASALVANQAAYFDALTTYRNGDVGPLVDAFTSATTIASEEARLAADRLASLPGSWNDLLKPRAGSATAHILAGLLNHPVFTSEDLEDRLGVSTSAIHSAINRLTDEGLIRPLTDRKRSQVWVASDVAGELDALNVSIQIQARKTVS